MERGIIFDGEKTTVVSYDDAKAYIDKKMAAGRE